MASGTVVVVGGTRGLGREVAQHYAASGRDVVVTGRDPGGAETCATEIGGSTRGIALDLGEPHAIADRLSAIDSVHYLVLAAIDRHKHRIHSGVAASTGGAAMRRSFGARMTFIRAMPVSAARVKSSSMPGSPMATQPMETFLPWMKMSPPRFVR